jgi:hypothetical protein
MTWNHRILAHLTPEGEIYFAVHECHYRRRNAQTPHSWSTDPVPVLEEDLPSLKRTLRRMRAACNKPILIEKQGKLVKYSPSKPRGRAKIEKARASAPKARNAP